MDKAYEAIALFQPFVTAPRSTGSDTVPRTGHGREALQQHLPSFLIICYAGPSAQPGFIMVSSVLCTVSG
jgi:hypothetical protein